MREVYGFYYGKTFGVWECIAGTFVLTIVMIGAAMIWGWLKRNHLPLARVFFWMFSGTSTAWYFMN